MVKRGGAWTGAVLAATVALGSAGCRPVAVKEEDRGPGRPGDPASWTSIRDLQNLRLQRLDRFSSAGTLTITLANGEDVDREQADHRIWRSGPSRAAIRVSKLGAAFMTAAWNGPRWWMFDEREDEVVLRIRPVEAPGVDAEDAAIISPPTLFAMLGLLRFPEKMPSDLVLFEDGCRFSTRSIDWGGGAAPLPLRGALEIEVGSPEAGPSSIRLLDDDGGEIARSMLSRFDTVDTLGSAPGAWPLLPHRVEVRRDAGDRVVMSFDAPVANGRVSDRLFDLEAQIRRSEPAIIEDRTPGGVD